MPFLGEETDEGFVMQALERYGEDIHDLSIASGRLVYEVMKNGVSAKGRDEIIQAGEETTQVIFHIVSNAFIEGLKEGLIRYARGDKPLPPKKQGQKKD